MNTYLPVGILGIKVLDLLFDSLNQIFGWMLEFTEDFDNTDIKKKRALTPQTIK
jgi:hypothetical protein